MTTEIIRILILVALFAGVFLVTQFFATNYAKSRSHKGAINRRLEMISSGQDREEIIGQLIKNRPQSSSNLPAIIDNALVKLQRIVFTSGISLTAPQLLFFMVVGLIAVFLLSVFGAALVGMTVSPGSLLICLLFALSIAVGIPLFVIRRIAESRRKRMEYQFPIALDIFVRALRSGHPIASAIDLLTKEMEDPIGSEFGLISDEVAYGADLVGALEHMADRWELEDMKMFVVSLSVQSQTGGNLAEILENISKVIRDRHQMFLKVKALSSEGRMTAWMLTVLPIFAFVSIFALTPQYYLENAEDPVFLYGAISLIIMYFLGVYIIRRMVDLKV
ncbi:type II secretion system F family protein [Altererythrobacter sp.]|uniref:type II secretion system F family protein n=1 Tax=Altererythrobacter sp. TaxID=1872480 RepID=UPI001B18198E|nr:type II secretion system F family protein [Altererythrobacter sp.]MBO6608737.1 type II secretion system F family protein [Altererythrobacter sp.]MBO6642992.1 type II secretion system F family protein [Altererythrobacter sp.]MBO6709735.1 type II secretion system F family protein [Altererythrobacter sp.]